VLLSFTLSQKCFLFLFSLDFISFTTAQPAAGTCTDTFTVAGTTTVAPTICGENGGQHSKIFISFEFKFARDLNIKLSYFIFSVFGRPVFVPYPHRRSINFQFRPWNGHSFLEHQNCIASMWVNLSRYTPYTFAVRIIRNITVVFFPEDSIAPADCLQYFSAASGRVKSFNWQDVAGTATRQLNNQYYNICFRTELVSSQVCIIRYFRTSVNLIAGFKQIY
jgi:hypothetical protein